MKVFKCKFDSIFSEFGNNDLRLRCVMLEDHDKHGGCNGEVTITSRLKMVDFERKFAVTNSNNIYDWS